MTTSWSLFLSVYLSTYPVYILSISKEHLEVAVASWSWTIHEKLCTVICDSEEPKNDTERTMITLVMKMCSKTFRYKTPFDKGENDLRVLLWAEWTRTPSFISWSYDSLYQKRRGVLCKPMCLIMTLMTSSSLKTHGHGRKGSLPSFFSIYPTINAKQNEKFEADNINTA